jgi:formylglycine-generating enzyme required for sulfatase activity/serine/threonine protein kinase
MYCNQCGFSNPDQSRFCSACGVSFTSPGNQKQPPPNINDIQTELGLPQGFLLADRYRIVELLGIGGMGRVYLAEDQKLGIRVAIKVLRETLSRDPGAVKRLIAEAKLSIQLSHPHVVRVNHFEDGTLMKFLVMEYVEGQTLAKLLADKGPLPEPEVRRIGIEICDGLEHAHHKKVIHRDIKPGNILLDKDGACKIADFGIARECRDSMSRLTSQVDSGTLLYMSPEQLDGEGNERGDIYSMGVLLYEMLAGDPPFRSGDIVGQIRNKEPKPLAGIATELNALVMRCLAKKPQDRFASVKELREELIGATEKQRREERQRKDAEERDREWTATRVRLLNQVVAALNAGELQDAVDPLKLLKAHLAQKTSQDEECAALDRRLQQALIQERNRDRLRIEEEERRKREEEAKRKAQEEKRSLEESAQREALRQREETRQRVLSLKNEGSSAFKLGNFDLAIRSWEEAGRLSPSDPDLPGAISTARQQLALSAATKARLARKRWLTVALVLAIVTIGTWSLIYFSSRKPKSPPSTSTPTSQPKSTVADKTTPTEPAQKTKEVIASPKKTTPSEPPQKPEDAVVTMMKKSLEAMRPGDSRNPAEVTITRQPASGYGSISITLDPPDAAIYLDGRRTNPSRTGPRSLIQNIAPGQHQLRFDKQGYAQLQSTIAVFEGQTLELAFTLQPLSPPNSSEMVFIPAGYFTMGSNDGNPNEKPPHRVWVDAYSMDKREVTNREYDEFIKATGHAKSRYADDPRFNAPEQPVIGVSWEDAAAYAKWAGKRLPTEAEWEKAARGGLEGKKYPWGDGDASGRANFGAADTGKTSVAGLYPANGYGLLDMAGNVWEWCADWYDLEYYANSAERNPRGPIEGTYRIVRGGAFDNTAANLRCSFRTYDVSNSRNNRHGIRCVKAP